MFSVAQGVHRMPETFVRKSRELAKARQRFERFAFPNGVIVRNIVYNRRGKHKETAIDPAVTLGFFLKVGDPIAFDDQRSKASRRADCSDRGKHFLVAVKLQQGLQVDVGKPIAIRKKEFFVPR